MYFVELCPAAGPSHDRQNLLDLGLSLIRELQVAYLFRFNDLYSSVSPVVANRHW